MRDLKTIIMAVILVCLSFPSFAVTGDDSVPGASCSPNKAVRVSANPSGTGGYILTCENGKWEATITAKSPTQPDQVATKRYVDDALNDSIATIDTHTYTNVTRYTDTGERLPILLSVVGNGDWAGIASYICSSLSNGQYVQGKIIGAQRQAIHSGDQADSSGTLHRCTGGCVSGLSGKKYAWIDARDFKANTTFYTNQPPGHFNQSKNGPMVETGHCTSWSAGDAGTITVNGECMADVTSSRISLAGTTRPLYHWGTYVMNAITCWSN